MPDKPKYIIIVGDGMVDRPEDFPGSETPLVAARTPNLDAMVSTGEAAQVKTIPEGMEPGSDVANMALMGYEPRRYYTGRAPLEAASMGLDLAPEQVAYRCNLVCLEPGMEGIIGNDSTMKSYSAGHIPSEESHLIIEELEEKLGGPGCHFYPGVSYRHLLVLDGVTPSTKLTPPHDITGRPIGGYLPSGAGAGKLLEIMKGAALILDSHPVNEKREESGQQRANSIWLWGQGKKPRMPSFKEKYGLTGAVISAVDLVKGLGHSLGMRVIEVPGATGYLDTNYEGKVEAALKALEKLDLAFIHVEAPDEAGHQGAFDLKVKAIEDFDSRVVGPILEGVKSHSLWAVMVTADHTTPLSIMTHSTEPVPYVIRRSTDRMGQGVLRGYNEVSLAGREVFPGGEDLIEHFLRG